MKNTFRAALLLAGVTLMGVSSVFALTPEQIKRAEEIWALKVAYPKYEDGVPALFRNVFFRTFTGTLDTSFSALNTANLGGIPADKFLKNTTSCTAGQVMTGINTDGTLRCAYKGGAILVKVHAGSVNVDSKTYNAGSQISVDSPKKFSTLPDCTTNPELTFEDGSLLRLDCGKDIISNRNGTSIRIANIPNNGSKSIAQVIYDEGFMWGRVLNPDIVQFQNGNFIAGVRGTSVAMRLPGLLEVFQSQKNVGNNGKLSLTPTVPAVWYRFSSGGIGTKTEEAVGCTGIIPHVSGTHIVTYQLLENPLDRVACIVDEKVHKNTKADIAYLNTIKATGIPTWAELPSSELPPVCTGDQVLWKWVTHPDLVCQNKEILGAIRCWRDEKGGKNCTDLFWKDGTSIKMKANEHGFRSAASIQISGDIAVNAVIHKRSTGTTNSGTIVIWSGLKVWTNNSDTMNVAWTAKNLHSSIAVGCIDTSCSREGYFPDDFTILFTKN